MHHSWTDPATNREVMNIAQQLARYLRSHPDGCDTAEGIARWWIDSDEVALPVTSIEAALAWMSECHLMEASHAADGRIRYRRASDVTDLDGKLEAMARDPHLVFPDDSAQQVKKVH